MISDIMMFNVKSGDLRKENVKVKNKNDVEVEISGDIDTTNEGYKVLIFYVDIYVYSQGQLYTIASVHNFSCQMTETDIVKFKDDDYLGMTNASQAAINQSYLIFSQKSSKLQLPIQPMRIPLFHDIYNDLKSGVYSLWN